MQQDRGGDQQREKQKYDPVFRVGAQGRHFRSASASAVASALHRRGKVNSMPYGGGKERHENRDQGLGSS